MASSSPRDALGRVGAGRYRLIDVLGGGPGPQVFVADDTRLHRPVVVKVLPAADAALGARVRAAAQTAAGLSHPHLVAVFDWGEDDDGRTWVVTELLGGGSLRALLDRGHRLTPSQALVVGLQSARGLGHAHDLGLVHGAVAPTNLLFGDDGGVRIAGLGVAGAVASRAGGMTGADVAPEQGAGLAPTGRSDVYALARVLVEAVTGSALAPASGPGPASAPSPLVLEDLGPLAGPVAAALAPDPADRPDARSLVAALARTATALPRPGPMPLAGAGDHHPRSEGEDHRGAEADDRGGPSGDPDPTAVVGPPDPPEPARRIDPTRSWRPPEPPAGPDRTVAEAGRADRDLTRVGTAPSASETDGDDGDDDDGDWDDDDDDGWEGEDDWDPRSPTGRRPWTGRILALLGALVVTVVVALLLIDIVAG